MSAPGGPDPGSPAGPASIHAAPSRSHPAAHAPARPLAADPLPRGPSRIPLWVDLRHIPVNKRLGLLHAIDEMAAEHVLVDKGDPHISRAGLRPLVVDGHQHLRDGPRIVGRIVKVRDAKSQARAAQADGIVVVQAEDWRVIPLENLVAARTDRPGTLFALARTPEEARLFAQVLETGVHGIVLRPEGPADLFAADRFLREAYRPQLHDMANNLQQSQPAGHGALPASATDVTPAHPTAQAPLPSNVQPLQPAAQPTLPPVQPPPAVQPVQPAMPPAVQPRAPPAAQGMAPPARQTVPQPIALKATPVAVPPRTLPPARAEGSSIGQPPAAAPITLEPARITRIADGGMGDRVCVDCTTVFAEGEGLLVGSSARSFLLVHAETAESGFVAARPFRVNAGAVHSYVLAPGGRTRYLSELRAGDEALAVLRDGSTRTVTLGRAKVERRPHILLHWRTAAGEASAMLQAAETVRLVRPDGRLVAVTSLAVGDEVLVHHEAAARHFGMPIEESLEER